MFIEPRATFESIRANELPAIHLRGSVQGDRPSYKHSAPNGA